MATTAGSTTSTVSASSSRPRTTTPTFRDKIKAKAGSAQTLGGMVWVYVGPRPCRSCRASTSTSWTASATSASATLPCNWLQIMENSVDPHHVEWLHGAYFEFLGQTQGFEAPKSFQKKHIKVPSTSSSTASSSAACSRVTARADDDWAIGHPMMFPYGMRVGGMWIDQMQIRVPIDDTTTWKLFYSLHHPEGGTWEKQERPVVYNFPWSSTRTATSSPTTSRARTSWRGSPRARSPTAPRSTSVARTRASRCCARCSRRQWRPSRTARTRRASCERSTSHPPALREGQVRRRHRLHRPVDQRRVDALQPDPRAAARPAPRRGRGPREGRFRCLTSTSRRGGRPITGRCPRCLPTRTGSRRPVTGSPLTPPTTSWTGPSSARCARAAARPRAGLGVVERRRPGVPHVVRGVSLDRQRGPVRQGRHRGA